MIRLAVGIIGTIIGIFVFIAAMTFAGDMLSSESDIAVALGFVLAGMLLAIFIWIVWFLIVELRERGLI